MAFTLFREIESVLQLKLKSYLLVSARATQAADCGNKEKIVHEVTSDDDVLFFWALLSVYIPNEDESLELLKRL